LQSLAKFAPLIPRAHAALTVLGFLLLTLGVWLRFGVPFALMAGGVSCLVLGVLTENDHVRNRQ
jgi:hypothetical protein